MKPDMEAADFGVRDQELLDDVLRAALEGPFFDEWEFTTIMGFTRSDLRGVAASWRESLLADTTDLVVTNVLVNLLGYPHGRPDAWAEYSRADFGQLADLLAKWRQLHPPLSDQTHPD